MKQSIEKLQKFFTLEASRGYDNRAVMGGLENMVDKWINEARADQIDDELIQVVVTRLHDYHRLSESSRKDTLHGIWKRLTREFEDIVEIPKMEPPDAGKGTTVDEAAPPPPASEVEKASPIALPEETPPIGPPAALEASVTVLDKVGPKYAETLGKIGIETLGDMLYHFPRRYDDYSKLIPINNIQFGDEVTVIGSVKSVNTRDMHNGKTKLLEAVIHDGTEAIRATWFNQPWMQRRLRVGTQVVIAGKVDQYLGRRVINNPELENIDQKNLHTNRIVPVYPLTANITQRWFRNLTNQVVSYWAPRVHDPLPKWLLQDSSMVSLPIALKQIHFPDSQEDLSQATKRLAFDEIFMLQVGVLQQKRWWRQREAAKFQVDETWMESVLGKLPYQLTNAQQTAVEDIRSDFASGSPMNRLLQGDVGSGKTIVAMVGAAMITTAGSQVAIMAPTSILAEQHYRNAVRFFVAEQGLLETDQLQILVGSTPDAEKDMIRQRLAEGQIKVIIGTHALLEEPVVFQNLQLAIIDEQHRFGVDQRAALRNKATNPHLLVMTATPIPRSLALTVYGDLDLTVMDEMPPGRQTVSTHLLYPRERERAYRLIRREVDQGRQAYIIYPLVEESDKIDAKAAIEEHKVLQDEVFSDWNIGLLHGRMTPAEKDEVMADFRDGKTQVLVSTSVVEVGVDVPNATVMIIEGANRFGLAQMHQLRGRVGRGEYPSYCILIPQEPEATENERLQVMADTADGFILAEKDLEQRGPGQFLGTRQSGYSELQLASLTDVHLIELARKQARLLFEKDPELELAEHQELANTIERAWSQGFADIS